MCFSTSPKLQPVFLKLLQENRNTLERVWTGQETVRYKDVEQSLVTCPNLNSLKLQPGSQFSHMLILSLQQQPHIKNFSVW